MTKDEWQEAERRALWKYGGLTLLVDGYPAKRGCAASTV